MSQIPWFKVDDALAFSSKVMLAGNAGMGLWVRAGSWSAAQLTDGFIPAHVALTLGSPDEAASLVSSGLWVEADGGYQFHDWDDYQPKKDDVLKEREDKRQRMADLRAKRRDAARAGSVTSNSRVTTPARAGSVTNLCSSPDPTRPDPSSSPVPNQNPPDTFEDQAGDATPRRKPSIPLPANWSPTKSHWDYAKSHQLNLEAEATNFRGHAETHDRRCASWNAAFATWLRKAKPQPTQQSSIWD